MTRFPIKAGSASAATSLTIAVATFVDVIAPIYFSFVLKSPQRLLRHASHFLPHSVQILRGHSRPDLVDLYSPVLGAASLPRARPRPARNPRRQQLRILTHELRQIIPHFRSALRPQAPLSPSGQPYGSRPPAHSPEPPTS